MIIDSIAPSIFGN